MLAAALFAETLAESGQGTVYYIRGPWLPWFFPCLELAGILAQAGALAFKYLPALWAGLLLVGIGAAWERDLALFIGDLLACSAIWLCLKK